MKIALIDPSLFTWPYDSALMGGLRAQGHSVTLYMKHLAAGEPGKDQPDTRELFYPGLQHPFFKKLPRSLFLAIKGISHFVSHLRLWIQLRRDRPDIIHFQWVPLPVVDQLFLPLYRKIAPLVLTVHDSSPFNNNPSGRLQRIGVYAIMHKFDRLIVHTEKARQALMGHGIPAAKINRIAHGVLGTGPAISATTASRREADGETVNVLLFGKLKPYKGADILIRALAALPEKAKRRCRVRIVGKAEMDTAPLMALAKDLQVEDHLVWDLRFVADAEMAGIFAEADIMAMPYRDIDASGVMMVALGMGRPIIASRIGLFAELLDDGRHGILVLQEDPAALANALATLINDADMRLRMGADVLSLCQAIPSWAEIGAQTTALYQSLR